MLESRENKNYQTERPEAVVNEARPMTKILKMHTALQARISDFMSDG